MDATFTAVLRLWEQGISQKEIAHRLDIPVSKTRKILVTAGAVKTEESALYASGMTPVEIAHKLGKTTSAVNARLPYSKGMYGAEYPTINALRIRRSRSKQK